MCLSGLFPDLHLPTHFIAVTTSRTVSELARLTHTLSQCEPNIGTPQVTSGGSGSVISPYCHKVSIRPCLSPLVPSRQLLQSNVSPLFRGKGSTSNSDGQSESVSSGEEPPSLTLTPKVYQVLMYLSSFLCFISNPLGFCLCRLTRG